ncbi:MAG: amidohydrolase [Hydrocarboniphaga sp.]|uniref:8-oxoguanine deaminase n=1 Tax=Hydrocarboniphaga sp. TaxID=2033016 RepID=UPI00261606F0|nr:8-oxoguanine deaminase [Hydrocarboniphaga sp.]MDB5971573.1 amidohydrolase [Hydrocarboniphaga sp.]
MKLLLSRADVLATQDDAGTEIRDGAVFIRDNWIERVGSSAELDTWIAEDAAARTPDRRIDLAGCVLLPGLINGHHHLYQTLTRSVGTAGGLALFDWLKTLYPIWGRMDPEAVYVSAKVGLVELLLSGATTVADHLYMFPNGARLDDEIDAAVELGVRFHPTRGSMSVGESEGGLPPDDLVEREEDILEDGLRVIQRYHDPAPGSMLRIGLAPCSPFSVSADLMRESTRIARSHPRVGLHTHLAETLDEERYCLAKFGMRPLDYAESLDWLGPEVWFAHMVHPNASDIAKLAHSCSGVCSCASSNMILASGIPPVRAMIDAGVRVGLGVDGSASNDGNHMLGEARQAMLLQRVGWPGFESRADRLSAREALRLATRGGAALLGREEIGSIEVGKAADLVAFRVDGLEHAGAQSDPVAALLTCAPTRVWLSVINGRVVVDEGAIPGLDLRGLIARHNAISRRMVS